MDDETAIAHVATALRTYVAARPNSADSARGIRDWWLADLAIAPTAEQVGKALARLEAEGWLVRHRLPDGSDLWRASPHHP